MMLRDKNGKITSRPLISGVLMPPNGKKSAFSRAFESGDAGKVVFEMKSLNGKPADQFDALLRLALSTGKTEFGKEAGVEAYDILRRTDILHLLAPISGPSEKIAFFVEIMRAKHGKFKPFQLLYLYKALDSYHELYFRCGNGLPKTWLSFYIDDLYRYNSRNTLSKYLGMYSTKAPSTYEQNVAAFLARRAAVDKKLLGSLAPGSYCKRHIQYEALHALNLSSPEHARAFAEIIIQRQLGRNVSYDFRTIEFAKKIWEQNKPSAAQPRDSDNLTLQIFKALR